MLTIQLLFVAFAVYVMTRIIVRFRQHTIGLRELAFGVCFWAAVAVCVIVPGITQWFAGILGVGRGADVVFYVGMVGLSYASFRLYFRCRRLEHQLAILVRKLALKEASEEDKP